MSLFERLSAAVGPDQVAGFEDESFLDEDKTAHRAAAVLIAVTDRPDPGVILTQRPDFLRAHAGQVAFPGGKIDDDDADEIAAALREAHEEIALDAAHVRIVGATDIYYSGSGYRITPVVGIIPPDLHFRPNPNEVDACFEVPLSFLLDPNNAVKKSSNWMGRKRQYYDMDWQGRRIWGVTAGIIANFVRRLNGVESL
jgi:8-oxo-dGTP pyrophosphatase MutT (NUDIX family)